MKMEPFGGYWTKRVCKKGYALSVWGYERMKGVEKEEVEGKRVRWRVLLSP
jgi:hypothetical protein